MDLLGQLFNTTAMTISRAAIDLRSLLEAHGVHIPASTARFRTPTDIARFLDLDKKDQTDVLIPGKPLRALTESSADAAEASVLHPHPRPAVPGSGWKRSFA
nr:hypothetical protein [Streptomyces sp. OUCMDZ-3434]